MDRTLLDMPRSEVVQWLLRQGEQAYRADQVLQWVYQKAVVDPEGMTNLSKSLRQALTDGLEISPLLDRDVSAEAGGETRKWLFDLRDGQQIECVSIPDEEGGYTICVSTQAGCGLKCAFCATGLMGFRRDLSCGEIVGQVIHLTAKLGRPAHLVFMGMGEPFHNYEAVMAAVSALTDKKLFNLGARRITVSTAGMAPEIHRLAREPWQVNLAISLGGVTQTKRAKLIPLGTVYSLDRVLAAADAYVERTGRRVTYEYVLLRGVTDTKQDAERMVELLSDRLAHVNLILWNQVEGLPFESPSRGDAARFRKQLQDAGISCTLRVPRGRSIHAACGQLAVGTQRRGEPAQAHA